MLHVQAWDRCFNLSTAISNALAHPESTRITEKGAAAATCHIISQDGEVWIDIIPVLIELCKRDWKGTEQRSPYPLQQICDKILEKLTLEHHCQFLIYIFNDVFSTFDYASLDRHKVQAISSLLVHCDECFMIYGVGSGQFLGIIEQLASQQLIVKEQLLDDVFLYTKHDINHSCMLSEFTFTHYEEAFSAILSAAEDYVQLPEASINSVLHPNQFTLPYPTPHPEFLECDRTTECTLIDNFNKKLKEIWARRETLEIVCERGDVTQVIGGDECGGIGTEPDTEMLQSTSQISPSPRNEARGSAEYSTNNIQAKNEVIQTSISSPDDDYLEPHRFIQSNQHVSSSPKKDSPFVVLESSGGKEGPEELQLEKM